MKVSCNSLPAVNRSAIFLNYFPQLKKFRYRTYVNKSKKIQNLQTPFSAHMHRNEQSSLWICAGREFRDFHFKPALLCWSSARLLGLNFVCCGQNTTRAFIVREQLTSSKEQQLFWAHETEAQRLGHRKWWPLNEQGPMGVLFGPAWLAFVTGSE